MRPPPRSKANSSHVYSFQAPAESDRVRPLCERLLTEDWRATLPYLTAETAPRHVLVPTYGAFEVLQICASMDPAFEHRLRAAPSASLLNAMPRLANSPSGHAQAGTCPLVSSVHVAPGEALPWARREPSDRPFLMSYGGSASGTPTASQLRNLLISKCREYGEPSCHVISAAKMGSKAPLQAALNAMRNSVFCLEPPGFGPERKSQVDALLLGCIPVTFVPDADETLWPTHWGPFRADSRVLIDIDDVISGRVDVLSTLSAISDERIAQMQSAIEAHAGRMHYSTVDMAGDALEILLRELVGDAS